ISTRRKRAVCKVNVLPSRPRRRNSSRLTRKRRVTCRVNVQHCALRERHYCRNSSSWRRTLPGQCTDLHYQELSFTPTFVLPVPHLLDSAPACFAIQYNAHFSSCHPSTFELSVLFSCSSRAQSAELNNSLRTLEQSQQELEKRLVALQLQHQQDSAKLQTQLDEADSCSKALQRECEESKTELSDLKEKYKKSEQEKQLVADELEECKANMKDLQEKGSKKPWMIWGPVVAVALTAVTAAVLFRT
uniref:Sarcolemma associated protein b n=1 Tax=Amphiprion percula TaxID=161767 RepID=A0A3P8SQV8_AMPPE